MDKRVLKKGLLKKIKGLEAVLCVLGLGHVGLPIAAVFSNRGFKVIGADIDESLINRVSMGEIHVEEPGLKDRILKSIGEGRITFTTDTVQAAQRADVIIVCVPTLVDSDKKPDLNPLNRSIESVADIHLKGKLLIISSTVPPRTIKGVVARKIEDLTGLKCGFDYWLAYCPERVTPGKALREFICNPRVIGGCTQVCSEIAKELYSQVVKGKIFITNCLTAEIVKLLENTYRDVNIALANEFALICRGLNINIFEAINLANTHPRVNIHIPGPGTGGPCIPKDPYFLLSAVEKTEPKLIPFSRQINEHMPIYVFNRLKEMLEEDGMKIGESKVLILGVAYKGDVEDTRNSPAETLIRKLLSYRAEALVYDPFTPTTFGAKRVRNLYLGIKESDCMVIMTDHSLFREIDLEEIRKLKDKYIIFDTRGIINHQKATSKGIKYVGLTFTP